MKRILFGIISLLFLTGVVHAADITLVWDPVDFASYGSDLAQSGYKVYHKNPDDTLAQIGQVASDVTTYTHDDIPMGINCYRLTAFNQYGESDYSDEACAGNINVPPAPDGTSITINISVTVNP